MVNIIQRRLAMMNNPFICGYMRAILFAETDEEGEPLDNAYTEADFSEDANARIYTECNRFLMVANEHKLLEGIDMEQAGHDFWLTRNGNGSGFWDKENIYGRKNAEILTIMSDCFGEVAVGIDNLGEINLY